MNLSEQQRAEIAALEAMSDEDIDYSDIPPVRDFSGTIHGAYHQLRTGARSPRTHRRYREGPGGPDRSRTHRPLLAARDRPKHYDRTHCVDLEHLRPSWKPPSPKPRPRWPWTRKPTPEGGS